MQSKFSVVISQSAQLKRHHYLRVSLTDRCNLKCHLPALRVKEDGAESGIRHLVFFSKCAKVCVWVCVCDCERERGRESKTLVRLSTHRAKPAKAILSISSPQYCIFSVFFEACLISCFLRSILYARGWRGLGDSFPGSSMKHPYLLRGGFANFFPSCMGCCSAGSIHANSWWESHDRRGEVTTRVSHHHKCCPHHHLKWNLNFKGIRVNAVLIEWLAAVSYFTAVYCCGICDDVPYFLFYSKHDVEHK